MGRMCRAANYPLPLWKSSFPNGPAAASGRAPTACNSPGSCAIAVPAHPCQQGSCPLPQPGQASTCGSAGKGHPPHTHTGSCGHLSPRPPCDAQGMWDVGAACWATVALVRLKNVLRAAAVGAGQALAPWCTWQVLAASPEHPGARPAAVAGRAARERWHGSSSRSSLGDGRL